MNSNFRQGKRAGSLTLTVFGVVVAIAGVNPAQAQTFPVAFPAPTTLTVGCSTCTSDPGDFSETSNCGTSRKAHWDCTITVSFTPTVTGTRSATLSIVDAVGTQTVQLNGTGK